MNADKIWANMPVQDIERTRSFFTQLGFKPNPDHGGTSWSASWWAKTIS